jgi:multiple sugar transport system substrate-binding protein
MSSESKHKDEAWKVLEYVYSDEVLVPYHEKGFAFSVVPSVLEKAKDAQLKGAADFKTTEGIDGVWPLAPAGQGMKAEGKTHYDVIAAVILGAVDIDEAIADMNKRYSEALEKDAASGKVKKIIIPDFNPSGL